MILTVKFRIGEGQNTMRVVTSILEAAERARDGVFTLVSWKVEVEKDPDD